MGFSRNTCLPALMLEIAWLACNLSGVAMITAFNNGSAKNVERSVQAAVCACAPCLVANALVRPESRPRTLQRTALGSSFRAGMRRSSAICPGPMRPTRSVTGSEDICFLFWAIEPILEDYVFHW